MPEPPSSESLQQVLNALVASGFPFQTAVAQLVRQCRNYSLVAEELPWRDDAGTDQFLDLVAVRNWFILTIECKKTQKEMLSFLRPSHASGETNEALCLNISSNALTSFSRKLFCHSHFLTPRSAESKFCVVSTSSSGKDQRMLEHDAQKLVRGTEAYANLRNRPGTPLEGRLLFVPVLVTNAKLFVADYDSSDVSLETGQFAMPPNAKVTPTNWVRFRKAFTSVGGDFGDRTIFVVAATALQDFLERLDSE